MKISVIICTYHRVEEAQRLLNCFTSQSYSNFEVLVVDGTKEDKDVCARLHNFVEGFKEFPVQIMASETGLTRQRNVGLRSTSGEIVVFLDDDVTVEGDFLERVAKVFADPSMADVGGITGYDAINYPSSPNWRWRLRKRLGVVPSLEPGFADRLGRNVPLSFTQPFSGYRRVSWLPGFCMIYRRQAVDGMLFDELLPTYGGEDRDFSMRVGDRYRLLMCGDLRVEHHSSSNNRVTGNRQIYQTAFGIGRGFRKRARGWSDRFNILTYAIREFMVESLAGLKHPSLMSLWAPIARIHGLIAGWSSLKGSPAVERNPSLVNDQQNGHGIGRETNRT